MTILKRGGVNMPEIEKHLHQLSNLLREQDSIKLVVRLESSGGSKIRYLAVVSCTEDDAAEEYCLLGIDCDKSISLGLVLAILSYTTIRLDGDGGFCVTTGDGLRSHIFKPVSVQTMWSALQSLYRASECAKENNSFQASAVKYYEELFGTYRSDPGCLTEWNILPGVEYKRPSYSYEELSFQERISCTLREILLCERDLDEVTSKEIRTKLECKLQIDLSHYKSFIDEEMLKILGQMEAPALILDHLYLGTEWNASHQQDLFDKQINYILNVTTEIDNFFPDTFRYMNIPVCDTEETDILRYFNDSYRFINKARKDGKNVLVHCKMGISRSATIVIAYVMKTRNWDLSRSLKHVKEQRNCVKPNPNFMKQLEVYEGILTAKRFSSTLEKRSKSESNLKQSDKSMLSTHNDRVMCSSNSDITDNGLSIKCQKKYFNTAPARLKPEKSKKSVSDLLKPKSSSCAAISQAEVNSLSDIVPHEVVTSFEAAVSSLEHRQITCEGFFSVQDTQLVVTSSLPNNLNEDPPTVLITDVENETRTEAQEEELMTSLSENVPISDDISPFSDSHASSLPMLDSSVELLQSAQLESTPTAQLPDDSKKVMSLKCCRRPYNGHTFSVSPNQVVNITAFVDHSKFSVRHLVNEFELHSNRLNQPVCVPDCSTESKTIDTPGYLSLGRNVARGKVRKHFDRGDTDYSSEDNQESESLPILSTVQDDDFRHSIHAERPSKKVEKLGCLPFFRKYSSLSSKSSLSKNVVSPSPAQHVKKNSAERSRDKPKDKGPKCKGKILEAVAKLKDGDELSSLEQNACKFQSTGVVKQRLEAFEAKAVPLSKHQLFFRSHNRSHSATGASTFETISQLSQRKTSMPHLETRNLDFDSPPFSHRIPLVQVTDRKSSLDSNNLYKSNPCVRGFQNTGGKSFFSTSPGTTSRQQHGSTHPLNLLPRTPTLT